VPGDDNRDGTTTAGLILQQGAVDEADPVRDSMPSEYCHIRNLERKVSDKFYQTCANLVGRGLGMDEASSAVILVAN
jgi:hypothetical protein